MKEQVLETLFAIVFWMVIIVYLIKKVADLLGLDTLEVIKELL